MHTKPTRYDLYRAGYFYFFFWYNERSQKDRS